MNSLEQDRLEELFVTLMGLADEKRPALLKQAYEESRELGEKLEEMASEYQAFDSRVMEKFTPDFLQGVVEDESEPGSGDGMFPVNWNSDTLTFDGSDPGLGLIQSAVDPDNVGPYKILKKIGEGGMGRVYLAEASRPKRQVALKIIANSQVNPARFKSEYETLARMNHEHIARLIDAGDTPNGETYFTMDYVDGKPLIRFCKENKLSLNARLDLFLQVCDGVQHAHQKAILHRDLKPSNILVSEDQDKPSVKLIDFGLAKALDHRQDDLFNDTQFGTLVGTPLYMSPEQLDRKNNHPDIRGDVYSLGVILYELLTDTHPLDLNLIKNVPLDEGLRICREEVCDRPSERLSKSATFVGDAVLSSMEVKQRVGMVRGDLDWIAMKAMDKDLERRYQTVSELIRDLHHYLADEPISARPPSVAYRTLKFIKRNKLLVTATTLTLTALLFGLTLAVYSSMKTAQAQAETQQALEKLEAVNQFLNNMLSAPDPISKGRDAKIVDLLEEMETQLADVDDHLQVSIRQQLGRTYIGLGLYGPAKANLEIAARLGLKFMEPEDPNTFMSRSWLAYSMKQTGEPEKALIHLNQLFQDMSQTLEADHEYLLMCFYLKGLTYRGMGRNAQAEEHFRKAYMGQRRVLGEHDRDTIRSLVGLANSLYFLGDYETSERYYQQALPIQIKEFGLRSPDTLRTMVFLGNCLIRLGKYNDASPILGEAVSLCREVFGDDHGQTQRALLTWGRCLNYLEQYDDARDVLTGMVQYRRQKYGPAHTNTLRVINLLANAVGGSGDNPGAIAILEDMVALCRENNLMQDPQYSKGLNVLGHFLEKQGDFSGASLVLEEALDIRLSQDPWSENALVSLSGLGQIYGVDSRDDAFFFAEAVYFKSRELRLGSSSMLFFSAAYAESLMEFDRFDEAEAILNYYAPKSCQADAHYDKFETSAETFEKRTGRNLSASWR